MARRRDHGQKQSGAPAGRSPAPRQPAPRQPTPPLPAPVRFNAAYRRLDAGLRRRPALLAVAALAVTVGITLARTFPLTAAAPLGGIAVLTLVGLVLGFVALGPLGAAAVAGWIAFSGLGDRMLAWTIGADAPQMVVATIAAPVALFLFLSAASWWTARHQGWDLRGSFAVALAVALALAPTA